MVKEFKPGAGYRQIFAGFGKLAEGFWANGKRFLRFGIWRSGEKDDKFWGGR
jgi:hypothetical protein